MYQWKKGIIVLLVIQELLFTTVYRKRELMNIISEKVFFFLGVSKIQWSGQVEQTDQKHWRQSCQNTKMLQGASSKNNISGKCSPDYMIVLIKSMKFEWKRNILPVHVVNIIS